MNLGRTVFAQLISFLPDSRLSRRPLRIGKLIKKRQIAPLLSVAHASWLTRPERDEEEQPDRVVEALNIPAGATAVDLGAGVGYFTWRLAKRVGPQGRVNPKTESVASCSA